MALLVVAVGISIWWWQFRPASPEKQKGRSAPSDSLKPVNRLPPLQQPAPDTPSATPRNSVSPAPAARATNPPPVPPAEETVKPPVPETSSQIERRPATNMLEAQIVLTWNGISSGSIDGVGGAQTGLALKAFQRLNHLEETGWLDRDTMARLMIDRRLFTEYIVTAEDLADLRPVPPTWLGKSQAPALSHETLLERVAEKWQAHPNFIRRLNPAVNWSAVPAGTELVVPNAAFPPPRRAALVRVNLAQKWIRAFDGDGRLLAHFPCSIGRIAEKRPVGELGVAVAVKDPNYTFNPEVFPESEEGRQLGRKLVVPPGPNNPVGVAWIGLNRPGYGIHGTPGPEQVGRTESHGCFRLANWNADFLRRMIGVGTPVWIE
jgi:lipoprotein-anchoring transpeptidase ErfK/SrfK